jgi:hypothetical protein
MAEWSRDSIEKLLRRATAAKARAARMATVIEERERREHEARRVPAVKSVTGTQAPTSGSPIPR